MRNFDVVRNRFKLQDAGHPLVDAIGTGTNTPQLPGRIAARIFVAPADLQESFS